MNYKKEEYPENLNLILEKANDISSNIIKKLNQTECPTIADLYVEMHKTCGVKPEYSIRRNVKLFNELGYVPNIKSGKVNSDNEFKGLYIFGEEIDGEIIPVYVGISRSIYKRLRNHAFGKTSNTCTLAYLMAKHKYETTNSIKKVAKSIIENETHLAPQKDIIQNYKVVLIPVEKDYDLYFLEIAIAGILKTKWNSFKTH
jgi:hypothetical protein